MTLGMASSSSTSADLQPPQEPVALGEQEKDNSVVPSNDDDDLHHVGRATYPIPQPLAYLLQQAISGTSRIEKETMVDALAQLVGNSIQAMDAMYFATPASTRNRPSFAHRLCLRVETSLKNKTLTITDLGMGMTRADLINSLGIGHLSHRAMHAYKKHVKLNKEAINMEGGGEQSTNAEGSQEDGKDGNENKQDDDDDSSSTSTSSSSGSSGSSSMEEEAEEEAGATTQEEDQEEEEEDSNETVESKQDDEAKHTKSNESNHHTHHHHGVIPCKATDVGGFYSALCALGVGVNVGTKSKFDDYYEFEVGACNSNSTTESSSSSTAIDFSTFCVTRPMKEGVVPTSENGFGGFTDVRGECGTRVTIYLNEDCIAENWLDEETLQPIFAHVLETTQYTVAFSSSTKEAQDIVEASRIEQVEMESKESVTVETAVTTEVVEEEEVATPQDVSPHTTVLERSKYIPIRLSLGERKMLRLVEAAMTCCDYTTVVDRPTFKSSARRTHAQLKGITSVLRGLVTACDYAAGQKLLEEDNFADYDVFFRQMLEIARRHKIMNPEKMRTEYGKLVFLLQDAVSPTVLPLLQFSCKGQIETVYKFLEERQGLALLQDKLIETATMEVLAGKKTRAKINLEIKKKEKAVAVLKQKYRSSKLSSNDIHLCLYSICDNNSFLNSNRVPIDKVIFYLKKFFQPDVIEEGYSLSIVSGKDGARLSHSHERQYTFALQSLTLWRDIIDDMFRLWHMAEEDLLSETVTYALKDTGQGMQRVQQSPKTYKAMQQILMRVQAKVKQWVGSSVIHMGDHNVPNALSFIDKYTQVPRILSPIVTCLENLEKICEKDNGIKEMVDTGFGGMEKLTKDILYDFFKSALDGSGADNFYDAGSCIDGRLTSAWNWRSQLPTKPFYPIFKLTGFTGFDGEFK